jgi:hypothetical protein
MAVAVFGARLSDSLVPGSVESLAAPGAQVSDSFIRHLPESAESLAPGLWGLPALLMGSFRCVVSTP